MAGEDGVGPEACVFGGGVDVVGEAAAAAVFGIDGGGRVVAGDDDCAVRRLCGLGRDG